MHKKLSSILLSFALVAGLMAVFPVSANASHDASSPVSFHPDSTGGVTAGNDRSRGDVLADRFDGTNNTAHLSAVTNQAPDRVQWRICPTGLNITDANGVSAGELSGCNIIAGEDTTATVPGSSGVFNPADEAYDIEYNIPSSLDNQTRDILLLACVGAGENADPSDSTPDNCQAEVVPNVRFDDAETGEPDVTTGEMVSYCTADTTGGPGGGGGLANDPCEFAGAATAAQQAQVAARFKPFPHGSPVPNNGFVIRVTTSPDLNANGFLQAARDFGADSDTESNASDQVASCTVVLAQADRTTHECVFPDAGGADDNVGQAVWAYSWVGGTAVPGGIDCSGTTGPAGDDECTLDSHFAVSQERRANAVSQSFVPGGGATHSAHQPPSPGANAGCQPSETPEKTHSEATLSDGFGTPTGSALEICMLDQFNDPFAGDYTEEATSPGNMVCGGAAHDHDGDGRIEHCHGTTAAGTGTATNRVQNYNATTGSSTITSCADPQATGGTVQNPPANHGCADAATGLKDTLTITWGTQPTEVFLAFTDPAPTNPSDPCRTGITFKRNNVGDTDNLIVCTYDSNGNPVPTDTGGSRITWTVTSPTNEPTTVRFNGSPPQETSGSNASANTSIVAERQGNNFVNVFLDNSNGNTIDQFTIEKQVEGESQPENVPTNLTARKSKRKVRGKAATPRAAECRVNRQVTLYKRVPGPNTVIGQDSTNNFGRWAIRVPKPRRGRYYARVTASTATDNGGQTLNCLADQSDDVRWRKRRR